MLAGRPVVQIERRITMLRAGDDGASREVELLLLLEKALQVGPADPARLGDVRRRIGAARAALDQPEPAFLAYAAALGDLVAAGDPAVPLVAAELVVAALAADRYDAPIAARVRESVRAEHVDAFWERVVQLLGDAEPSAYLRAAAGRVDHLEQVSPLEWSPAARAALAHFVHPDEHEQQSDESAAVRSAVQRILDDPGDEEAARTILGGERRAAPLVREALENLVSGDLDKRDAEARLVELLRAILPDWIGFSPEDRREKKLEALRAAQA